MAVAVPCIRLVAVAVIRGGDGAAAAAVGHAGLLYATLALPLRPAYDRNMMCVSHAFPHTQRCPCSARVQPL